MPDASLYSHSTYADHPLISTLCYLDFCKEFNEKTGYYTLYILSFIIPLLGVMLMHFNPYPANVENMVTPKMPANGRWNLVRRLRG
jgi:hypothetical protein